jgi:hypothetical protein
VPKFVHKRLGHVVKKSNVLSCKKEKLVLVSDGASIPHACDLNNKMGCFPCCSFSFSTRMNSNLYMQINSSSISMGREKSF